MTRLDDGRFILLGLQSLPSDTVEDAASEGLFVISIASDGTEQWRRQLTSGERIGSPRVASGPDGSIFVCDSSQNYYRLNQLGEIDWHIECEYWLDSTCLDLAYHPDGLLVTAGVRTFGRNLQGTYQREAALTGYDAADGSRLWQVGYRPFDGPPSDPNDITFGTERTIIRIHDETIDWLGWGYVGFARFRDDYPWSISVSPDGSVQEETPVYKLMAESSFGKDALVAFAPPNWTLLLSSDTYEPRLVAWVDADWRRPYYRRFDPYRTFGWSIDEDVTWRVVIGADQDSTTLLFCHYDRHDPAFRFDLYTKRFGNAEISDDEYSSVTLERSADLSTLYDIVADTDDFELRPGAGVFLLVADETGRRRIEYLRILKVPGSVGDVR